MGILNVFRTAISFQLILIPTYIIFFFYTENPYEQTNERLPSWYNNIDDNSLLIFTSIFFILLIFLTIFSLLRYRFAVYSYSIVIAFSIPFDFSVYGEIETPLLNGLTTLEYVITGFILALVYFSPLKEKLR